MLIGIDVAKAELVVGSRPAGERWTVANDEPGVRSLVERLQKETPEVIVLEATGGYELLCVAALAAAALCRNLHAMVTPWSYCSWIAWAHRDFCGTLRKTTSLHRA